MRRPHLPRAAIDYPESDGKLLAENDPQFHAILYAVGALWLHYRERADVYVSGDLLIYYEQGNPRVSVAPDTFVVFGVADRRRRNAAGGWPMDELIGGARRRRPSLPTRRVHRATMLSGLAHEAVSYDVERWTRLQSRERQRRRARTERDRHI